MEKGFQDRVGSNSYGQHYRIEKTANGPFVQFEDGGDLGNGVPTAFQVDDALHKGWQIHEDQFQGFSDLKQVAGGWQERDKWEVVRERSLSDTWP